MADFINNLIEYSGIINELPQLTYPACFKQSVLQDEVVLAAEKPDIGQFIRVAVEITVTNTRIVKTMKGVSEGGQVLTGKKLVVEGEIGHKIEYVSKTPSGGLHAEYISTPFVMSIAIPKNINNEDKINAAGYIEDINVRVIDNRRFYKSIAVLITVEY